MNAYRLRKLILLRHPEDLNSSRFLTSVGEGQKKEVASLVKCYLENEDGMIGIFSSPAHRTKVFAEEIRKQLGLEDSIDTDPNLLSPDFAVSHLESYELPIMIVITHKEVMPRLISWGGSKLGREIFKEHMKRPRFASGWTITEKTIKPIGPIMYD